ncbi:hypothetical protein GCM10019016_138200 [Streptomyces prasinosporus]|uniref:Uncharacterized protein n=1 Tax=Streptomyces prasinosporus TaxID=68256 RepID=A0ABP6UII6_9ACTN
MSSAHRVSWVISTIRSLAWGSGGRPSMLADGSGSGKHRTAPRPAPGSEDNAGAPPGVPGAVT